MFTEPQGRLRVGSGSALQRTESGLVWDCLCVLASSMDRSFLKSVYMNLLNPPLRAFTWKLKGIIRAVGPGEKQGANPKTTTYGLTAPLSYCDFHDLGLGRICGASPHTQVLTTYPPKEERSPNSARECSAWWERWGHLLDVIYWFVQMLLVPLAYTG